MNISFALTTPQFRQRAKDVTRRNGWDHVQPGQILTGIEKGQGLKKGQHPVKLGQIRVVSVRRERLDRMVTDPSYGESEVIREGFPKMSPAQFVDMYCRHNDCQPSHQVTRIEFEYLCSVVDCREKAVWCQALHGEPVANGKLYCAGHALVYGTTATPTNLLPLNTPGELLEIRKLESAFNPHA